MTSLTQIAITIRKIIRYGIFFLIFLIIGRIVLGIGVGIYRTIFPPAPPPPTVSFGKLPKLPFPQKTAPANLSYTLETAEGGLPKFSTQAKVFFIPKLSPNLLSLDLTKEKAGSLGFKTDPQKVSETVYRFSHKSSPSTLEVNIITGVFSISYDLGVDSSPLQRKPPVAEIAASQIRSYLSSASSLPEDLTGPTNYGYLKLSEGKFVSALSLSEANLVKVNLFRKNYDNLTSLTPDPNEANVWFVISGALEREKQIIAGQYHYFPVDEGKYSTYPIKTAQAAWDELNSGKAYIATPGINKDNDKITIRKIYLAYYDAGEPTDFYQPIFVFEGDRGFIAYLPAVTSAYYGE
jgi:hypothetical protein